MPSGLRNKHHHYSRKKPKPVYQNKLQIKDLSLLLGLRDHLVLVHTSTKVLGQQIPDPKLESISARIYWSEPTLIF